METAVFYLIAVISIVGSIRVVLGRNAVHSAVWLVLVFFCFGGLYVLLRADFVAAVQVIVYAGAIMVLFLFVIMLLRVDCAEDLPARHRLQRLVGVLLGFGILTGIGFTVMVERWPGPVGVNSLEEVTTQAGGNTQAVGEILFNDYLLPFEITSVLLLAAIVGAVVLAKRTKDEK